MTLIEELKEALYLHDEDGCDYEQGQYIGMLEAIGIVEKHLNEEYQGLDLYLKDNGANGSVHKYGTNPHDSLILKEDGSIEYYNLQNGTGTGCPEEGYEFCLKDGTDPRKDERWGYGDAYLNIGGK